MPAGRREPAATLAGHCSPVPGDAGPLGPLEPRCEPVHGQLPCLVHSLAMVPTRLRGAPGCQGHHPRGTIPGATSPWHLQVMLEQRKASAQDRGGHNQDARGLGAGMLLPPPSFSIQLTLQPAPEPAPKHKGGWARGRRRVWGRLGPRQCQQAAAGLVTALQLQPRGAREAGGWGWEVDGGATARPP